jgi:putative nucleotidyltransferase with HDIG domain
MGGSSNVAREQIALVQRLDILHRADIILHHTEDLGLLLQRFLDLTMEAAQVEVGTLYLVDEQSEELVFAVVRGPEGVNTALQGHRMPVGRGIVGHCAQQGEAIWVPEVEHSRHWAREFVNRSGYRPRNVLCLPLKIQERVVGVVQLLDHPGDRPYTQGDLGFLGVLVNDLALKVENARLLDASRGMVARLRALLDVGVELGATLDRGHLLHLILERVGQLVQAEAASVFELAEETGELVLCAGTQVPPHLRGEIRMPVGEGIAGWVAREGHTIVIPDVSQDPRFYPKVDEQTDFRTRSILSTPLAVQEQVPGEEGVFRKRVIGVAQALNKRDEGGFTAADVEIFEALAQHAAVAMERTRLYRQINEMFTNAIAALAEAMEAKDPYTRGHTRRVTAVSAAIAEEMGLRPEQVARIRTAGLLHDIGKIGMPDHILHKPGQVTEAEVEVIRRHPLDGARILNPLHHLRDVIPGVAEHHERYDGSGYPRGLRGEEISLAGRIIAVADVFDAMTSNRPYRRALPVETAVKELRSQAGRQFDPQVMAAFVRVWEQGRVPLAGNEPAEGGVG